MKYLKKISIDYFYGLINEGMNIKGYHTNESKRITSNLEDLQFILYRHSQNVIDVLRENSLPALLNSSGTV